jgi:hypothetical protein
LCWQHYPRLALPDKPHEFRRFPYGSWCNLFLLKIIYINLYGLRTGTRPMDQILVTRVSSAGPITCLRCGQPFWSWDRRHNRLCLSCLQAIKEAVSVQRVHLSAVQSNRILGKESPTQWVRHWIAGSALVLMVGGMAVAGQPSPLTPEQSVSQAQQLLQAEQQQCGTGRNPQACERAKTLQAQVAACREGNRQACAALAQQRR